MMVKKNPTETLRIVAIHTGQRPHFLLLLSDERCSMKTSLSAVELMMSVKNHHGVDTGASAELARRGGGRHAELRH